MNTHRLLKIGVITATVLLLILALTHASPPSAEAVFDDTDGDGVIDLAEELAGSDPADPDSLPESTGAVFLTGHPVCSDGIDNDGDGLIDDDDPYCTDSDGDIVSDPAEEFLGSDPNDFDSFPEDSRVDAVLEYQGLPVFFCADGRDNDGDGLTDADDPGCEAIGSDGDGFDDATEKRYGSDPTDPASVPEHEVPNPGSCSDGIDNDLDGLTDAADPACGTPDNDDRADAIDIASLPFNSGPTIVKNATTEDDEPFSSCTFGGALGTVWYSFTATADARLVADTAGSEFETTLSVWRVDGPSLRQVVCDYSFGTFDDARTVFQASAGETYLFQIDGFPFDPLPTLTFNLEVGQPPANDDFADATDIATLPFSDSVNVLAANTEFGEPSCGGSESSVWYRFTPAEDTLVVADTIGSDYPPIIGVFTQTVFGLAHVACSDSFFGPPQDTRLAVDLEAGKTYYFQVARFGFVSPGGYDLTFNVAVGVPPANDNFASATVITSLPFSDTADTFTATVEPDEPSSCQYYGIQQTVWYEFTPAEETFVLASALGGNFAGVLVAVYEGSSLADLQDIACAMPGYPDTRLGLRLDAGERYFFQVGTPYFGPIFVSFGTGIELDESSPDGIILPPGPPPSAGSVTFDLDFLDVPDCPTPNSPVPDPLSDRIVFFGPAPDEAIDIISTGTSSTGDWSCLTVEFAGPIDPYDAQTDASIYTTIGFDTDLNTRTGYSSGGLSYSCSNNGRLGFEASIDMYGGSGILYEIYPFFYDEEFQRQFAIALFDERSFTLAVPLDALGGDDEYTYALIATSIFDGISDCAPNGGVIRAPEPAETGDANCDGHLNALDSILMLQLFAGLKVIVPCQNVADVNGSGVIGPIDAMLVLQYDAGLLHWWPPR